MQPNVVLIVLDTARRDAFEPYGAPHGASPAIADLARRGSASPNVYAASSWTMPSHVAMLSGLMPRGLGLGQAPDSSPQSCKPSLDAIAHRLLPTVLRDNGYETRGISTNTWLQKSSGFANGFDEFVAINTGRTARMAADTFKGRSRWRFEAARAQVDDGARKAEKLIEGWARDRGENPFFWFVNLVECHSPYLPPRGFNSLSGLERIKAADEASEFLTLEAIWRACAGALEVPDEALERMRRLYADAIRYLDSWVERVLGVLEQAGCLDDTLVIVTSDHGENFSEVDGLMAHAFSLDQRLIHMPFVCAGPAELGSQEAFGLVDLPRRIADGIGLDTHPFERAPDPGVVVSEFDPPAPIDDPRWQELLGKWGVRTDEVPDRIGLAQTIATDGRWKLVEMQERGNALYDIEADPDERSAVDPSAVEPELLARLETAVRSSVRGEARAPSGDEAEMSQEERERLEESMRMLGYM